jgi:hypothetical protein
MHNRAHPPQLLDHEPPTGRRLQGDLELLTIEPLQEPAHPGTVGRGDPTALNRLSSPFRPYGGRVGQLSKWSALPAQAAG